MVWATEPRASMLRESGGIDEVNQAFIHSDEVYATHNGACESVLRGSFVHVPLARVSTLRSSRGVSHPEFVEEFSRTTRTSRPRRKFGSGGGDVRCARSEKRGRENEATHEDNDAVLLARGLCNSRHSFCRTCGSLASSGRRAHMRILDQMRTTDFMKHSARRISLENRGFVVGLAGRTSSALRLTRGSWMTCVACTKTVPSW